MSDWPPALRAALVRAQHAGMLGPDDVERQIAHALEFLHPFAVAADAQCVDLGSGGGIPGLPLALALPATRWVLVDAWEARCEHLRRAVVEVDLTGRVSVLHARAEEAARGVLRSGADVVVARSFGPPALALEAGVPMLTQGGRFVASSATLTDWPAEVPELGAVRERVWATALGSFVAYQREGAVDPRFPRRPAAQRRAPLF